MLTEPINSRMVAHSEVIVGPDLPGGHVGKIRNWAERIPFWLGLYKTTSFDAAERGRWGAVGMSQIRKLAVNTL